MSVMVNKDINIVWEKGRKDILKQELTFYTTKVMTSRRVCVRVCSCGLAFAFCVCVLRFAFCVCVLRFAFCVLRFGHLVTWSLGHVVEEGSWGCGKPTCDVSDCVSVFVRTRSLRAQSPL